MRARRVRGVGAAAFLLGALLQPRPVTAQAPFYTDDTGVTEPGALHLEASDEIDALQSMQYPDFRQNTANLKVNVGLPHGFELDVDAPYLTINRASGSRSSRGLGDTNLGLKWRLREASTSSRLPALALSFYTEFPTGNSREELGSGVTDYWLNGIAQVPLSERTRCTVNVGILFAGNTSTGVVGIETTRGHVYTGGLSVLHDVSSRFTVGGEIFGGMADTNGLDRTQLQAMLGMQYAILDHVTVYAGLIAGTFTASPRVGGQIGFSVEVPNAFHSSGRSARPLVQLQTAGEVDGL